MQSTHNRFRHVAPPGWWFDGLLVIAFAVLTTVLWQGHLLFIDLAVRNWADAHQPAPLHWLARAGNLLGQGGFFTGVAAVLALFLCWRRRSVRPILPVIWAFVLTFVAITLLKDWTDRAAPHANHDTPPVLHPERFGSGGESYPSGHLANALVWYGVLALLLTLWLSARWRWVLRIVPPAILTITTVYLGFHWLSDTVAGILLGTFLWRLIGRVPWDTIPLGRFLTERGWAGPALETAVTGDSPPAAPRPPLTRATG
jgi:membrane-associated phospholipid phosphatase